MKIRKCETMGALPKVIGGMLGGWEKLMKNMAWVAMQNVIEE